MSIKRILVPIPGAIDQTAETGVAISATKALEAHVEALFITEPPQPTRGMSAAQGGYAINIPSAASRLAEERARRVQEAHESFARSCAVSGVPLLAATEQPGTLPSASWRETEGLYQRVAVQRAMAFDLVVAASAAVVEMLKDIAEASLLQTQRPVLLAPTRLEHDLTGTVMIAWDESLQCWHAVSAAIPFLQRARSVEVVSVDRNGSGRQASQAEVLTYLRCHGVTASARIAAHNTLSVGQTLLAEASESRAGLLVMGAYSHSRLREMLLGGATREVLRSAAATPVLMAH